MIQEIQNKINEYLLAADALKVRAQELVDRDESEDIEVIELNGYTDGTNEILFRIPIGSFIIGTTLTDLGLSFAPRGVKIVNHTISVSEGQLSIYLFLSSAVTSLAYMAKITYYQPTT